MTTHTSTCTSEQAGSLIRGDMIMHPHTSTWTRVRDVVSCLRDRSVVLVLDTGATFEAPMHLPVTRALA